MLPAPAHTAEADLLRMTCQPLHGSLRVTSKFIVSWACAPARQMRKRGRTRCAALHWRCRCCAASSTLRRASRPELRTNWAPQTAGDFRCHSTANTWQSKVASFSRAMRSLEGTAWRVQPPAQARGTMVRVLQLWLGWCTSGWCASAKECAVWGGRRARVCRLVCIALKLPLCSAGACSSSPSSRLHSACRAPRHRGCR